jgi:hypothetical protein
MLAYLEEDMGVVERGDDAVVECVVEVQTSAVELYLL